MFIFNSIAKKIIIAVISLNVIVMGYLYIQNLLYKIEIAEHNQQKLQTAIEERDLIIEKIKSDLEKMQKINEEISEKYFIAEKDISNLQKIFNKPRNYNKMAEKNAKELQEKINLGTKFALRCNEIVTGSPIVPEDDNNNICRELIKSKKVLDK
jgi:hypothetical protein